MAALWAVLGGIIGIFLGVIGLIYWWAYFLKALAAMLPVVFIFGGAIALFIGISELRDSLRSKDETDFSDFKTEDKEEKKEAEEKPADSKEKSKKTSKK
jgi:lipoprotein signal peptidase